jgi:carbamoyltransferase
MSFFNYHIGGNGLSEKGIERFGPARNPGEALEQKHMDLAASVQKAIEHALCHVVSMIPFYQPAARNLCIAGGLGLNVCSNRKIFDMHLFKKVFITPPAYDGGTSLGSALYLYSQKTQFHEYEFSVYAGPDIEEDFDIKRILLGYDKKIKWTKLDTLTLCKKAAQLISLNKIIGWVQGRMECGPRALGNRSYLTNPANPNAPKLLNSTVKKREPFRPYAPSVLKEYASEWFDLNDSPYMLLSAKVLPEKQKIVPGIVHIDGTARPQTVTKMDNPKFYQVIRAFYHITGIPIVLNTSFNAHGQPIINSPEEAIENLLSTKFDALFMGDYFITTAR